LGIAGIAQDPDRTGVEHWLARALPRSARLVVSDVDLVLAAGIADRVGLAVVSGTGSVVVARDKSGQMVKVGGRGPVDGDPGSGHAIGLAAWATGRFHPYADTPRDIAALVPEVVAAADGGNRDARRMLENAGRDLAEQAAQAMDRIGWQGTTKPCALGGGVVTNVARVRDAFIQGARELSLQLDPVTLVPRPVQGAIVMASRLAKTKPVVRPRSLETPYR
jgi:N-acetylglucosamine kinase-like BadF-type ATPase